MNTLIRSKMREYITEVIHTFLTNVNITYIFMYVDIKEINN